MDKIRTWERWLSLGNNRNKRSVFPSFFKLNQAGYQSEKSMIPAYPNILAWMVLGATLANDNIASNHFLATINFNTKPFAFRLASVFYFAFPFFVCHGVS